MSARFLALKREWGGGRGVKVRILLPPYTKMGKSKYFKILKSD